MRIMTILFCAAAVLMAAWVAYGALAVSRVEEPPYQVLKSEQGIEIRPYEPYRVAEVRVAGYEIASSQGFRLLARYIFGHNVRQQKMAMTKPVIQNPAAGNENALVPAGETIEYVLSCHRA